MSEWNFNIRVEVPYQKGCAISELKSGIIKGIEMSEKVWGAGSNTPMSGKTSSIEQEV